MIVREFHTSLEDNVSAVAVGGQQWNPMAAGNRVTVYSLLADQRGVLANPRGAQGE
jgi:hypothetical protein